MLKPCNPEGRGCGNSNSTFSLQTLGGSVEARGKPVGLVCISCPDLSGLVGPVFSKFSVTEWREISAWPLRESWAKAGRISTPSWVRTQGHWRHFRSTFVFRASHYERRHFTTGRRGISQLASGFHNTYLSYFLIDIHGDNSSGLIYYNLTS